MAKLWRLAAIYLNNMVSDIPVNIACKHGMNTSKINGVTAYLLKNCQTGQIIVGTLSMMDSVSLDFGVNLRTSAYRLLGLKG